MLDSVSGVLLEGGELVNGTITAGTSITGTGLGGNLRQVTVNGVLNLPDAGNLLTVSGSLTVNGAATLATGSNLIVSAGFNTTTTVSVNGTFTSDGAVIGRNGSGFAKLRVNAGGQLTATGSSFTLNELALADGAVFNAGDLADNAFDTTLVVTAAHIPLLSASGGGADNRRFRDIQVSSTIVPTGTTLNLDAIGTETMANLRYVFPNDQTIETGATLNIGAGVNTRLLNGNTIAVDGTMNMATGSQMTFAYSFAATTRIIVGSGGLLDVDGAQLIADSLGSNATRVIVNAGGRLQADSSVFELSSVTLADGAVFNAGDLTDNAFDTTLVVTAAHIPLLSASGGGADNRRFRDIQITSTIVPTGTTLNLDAIGTETMANLRYVFPNDQTIETGATLNIGTGVNTRLLNGNTIAVDGTMNMATGSQMTFAYSFGATTRIVVGSGGLIDVDGSQLIADSLGSNTTRVVVNAGGQLQAGSSVFELSSVTLADGAVFNAGDLADNAFDTTLVVTADHIPLLSASGGGADNRRFRDVQITSTAVPTGTTLNLDAIGTETTANLRYVFPNDQTIETGATLNIAAGVNTRLLNGKTIAVNGTMNMATGSQMTFEYSFSATTRIIVGNGGLLNLDSAALIADTLNSNATRVVVNAGGQLQAGSSVFELSSVTLADGAVFNAGDLADNAFDTTLVVTADHIPLLSASGGGADNRRFRDIQVSSTIVPTGTTLNLDPIGTQTTANLRYVFPNDQTVETGATLNVGAGVNTRLLNGKTITANGTMTMAAGSQMTFEYSFGATTRIVVGSGGLLDLDSAAIRAESTTSSNLTLLQIIDRGRLRADNSSIYLRRLLFEEGSTSQATMSSLSSAFDFGPFGTGESLGDFTSLIVSNGSEIRVPNTIQIDDDAILHFQPDSQISVAGHVLGSTTNPAAYQPRGRVSLDGNGTSVNPQLFEAMSLDQGLTSTAFSSSFAIGSLTLSSGTYAKLVDQSDNAAGTDPEAVYVNSIIIPAGTTLDLNGISLYARQVQQGGSVTGGAIQQLADSGPLSFGVPTPGTISIAGELDEWTFFQRAGRSMSIQVNPGTETPFPATDPSLQWARVQLVSPSDQVLAETFSTTAGEMLTLPNVALPEEGLYRIRINAPASHTDSTGNYVANTFDSTPVVRPLNLNQPTISEIRTTFGQDQWTFTAAANDQVNFHLINADTPEITFSLTGPGGFEGFVDINDDSPLLTLPENGTYELIAHSNTGAVGNYAFTMFLSSLTDIVANTVYDGTFAGSGQAQMFTVNVGTPGLPLSVLLNDADTANHNELYVQFNQPPTRQTFDYGTAGSGSSQRHIIPAAPAGLWYILVYSEFTNSPPTPFTLEANSGIITIEDTFPPQAGSARPFELTINGVGFLTGTTVELVASDGVTIVEPISTTVDSYTRLTAQFSDSVTVDTYSVRVRNDTRSDTVDAALTVTHGGQPNLETQIIMPPALGRQAVGTVFVEYANIGDVVMPAPLLSLRSSDEDGSDHLILTLDETRIVENFWAASPPPGTSESVMILGSGEQPGYLHPGERIRVPVYFLGLQQPWDTSDNQIEMEIRYWSEDDALFYLCGVIAGSGGTCERPTNGLAIPIDWASREEELRPPNLTVEQWSAIYGNLTDGLPTTNEYVQMLNENARYLARLGQHVTDVNRLWNFEVQQAYGYTAVPTLDSVVDASMPGPGISLQFSRSYGNSIYSRYQTGPLGYGWSVGWQTRLMRQSGGDIIEIVGQDGSARTFVKDRRSGRYFSGTGDTSTLRSLGGSVYELSSTSGTSTRFRADGKIDFVADTNDNRVTAGYDAFGRLATLTHSSGASLTFTYNAADLISTITDSAGRITSYTYDAPNSYLQSVTTDDGKVTNYTYETSGSVQTQHALLSIERGGTTQFFTYDTRGRLDTSFLSGGAQFVQYGYDNAGLVTVDDDISTPGVTSLYFDANGQVAKTVDPLNNVTTNEFDESFRLKRTVSPTGESQSFTWHSSGSLASVTDELGNTTHFAHQSIGTDGVTRMTGFTDAKGNPTRYGYDNNGNLLHTIYADGSIERLSSYTTAGLPGVSTNRRGQPLRYTYNDFGQVLTQTFADGSVTEFEYDTRGNLSRVIEDTDITLYEYELSTDGDRLKRVTYPNGRFLEYTYDEFGRRIEMVDQDSFATRYEYDAAGRLFRLRDADDVLLVTYLYDEAGRLSRIEKGNGTFTTYEYDAAGNILSLKNWRNETELNSRFDYTYDSRGRRITMDTLDGRWTYGYDGTGQLTRAVFVSLDPDKIPHQDLQYFYDAVGNRSRAMTNGREVLYVTNSTNEYAIVDGQSFTLDADGNVIDDGTSTFTYDQNNRLIRIQGPSGTRTFSYDHHGNLNQEVTNGEETQLTTDAVIRGNIVSEEHQSTGDVSHNVFGYGLLSRIEPRTQSSFYEFDVNGSTSGLVNQQGEQVGTPQYYDPNGRAIGVEPGTPNAYGFGGQSGIRQIDSALFVTPIGNFDADSGGFSSSPFDNDKVLSGINIFSGLLSAATDYSADRLLNSARQLGNIFEDYTQIKVGHLRTISRAFGALGVLTDGYRVYKNGEIGGVQDGFGIGLGLAALAFSNPAVGVAAALYGTYRLNEKEIDGFLIENSRRFALWIDDAVPQIGDGLLFLFRDEDNAYPGDEDEADVLTPRDPNEKKPTLGHGPESFVSLTEPVPYRVDFENYGPGSVESDGTPAPESRWATAPAQNVTISDFLSADFDWRTFQLTSVGFGDTRISIPAGARHFQTTRSLTYNGNDFDVLIELGIHSATGEVYASFQSIDPDTQLPPDVLTGFLPPEDGTGRGQGFFTYSVRPIAGLPTGHEIRNVALISFDNQFAIATDQIDPLDASLGTDPNKQARITIDAVAPTSQLDALPEVSPVTFDVIWSGTDDTGGSGIDSYDVYVSDNGGPYLLWQSGTIATSSNFTGLGGREYRFQVVARDNVGNVQGTPSATVATETTNTNPIVNDQTIIIEENSPHNTVAGTVTGSDADEWQSLTWSIQSGNIGGAFEIDPDTGVITVANPDAVDFEITPVFNLVVQATDNGATPAAGTGNVVIRLLNQLEVSPSAVQLILPLYEYPLSPVAPNPLNPWWQEALDGATATTPLTIIANPDSGPILPADIRYQNWITALTAVRQNPYIRIIGYVKTRTNGLSSPVRTAAEILADVDLYVEHYNHPTTGASLIDGIFLDEMSDELSDLNTYVDVAGGIRSKAGLSGHFIVGNPGKDATVDYLDQDTADVFIIREGTPSHLAENADPDYVTSSDYAHVDFGAIIHTAVGDDTLTDVLRALKLRQFDYAFVTDDADDNVFDEAPTYFATLLRDIHAPYIAATTYTLAENSAQQTVLGTPASGDPDAGQVLTYSILDGNTDQAFAINASTGELSVNMQSAIDFELHPSFDLVIQVSDNSPLALSDEVTITVNLTDINEGPSNVSLSKSTISENAGTNALVGLLSATDPDAGDTVTFSLLTAVDDNSLFRISANELRTDVPLDFAVQSFYTITVRATDVAGLFVDQQFRITSQNSAGLTLTIFETEVDEFGGTAMARVSRSTNSVGDLVVTLTSSDLSEATVPGTITIPDGQSSATFEVTAVNDGVPDGNRLVNITASAIGHADGEDSVVVTDGTSAQLDVDGDSIANAATDGILAIRYLFGFRGEALTQGAVATNAANSTPEQVEAILDSAHAMLDVDGDGTLNAATDGILILRYLFGFVDDSLVFGAVGTNAIRTTGAEVAAFLSQYLPNVAASSAEQLAFVQQSGTSDSAGRSATSTISVSMPLMTSSSVSSNQDSSNTETRTTTETEETTQPSLDATVVNSAATNGQSLTENKRKSLFDQTAETDVEAQQMAVASASEFEWLDQYFQTPSDWRSLF
ncbi:MAG: cadherin domain-containing protein [Planctomycetaceae bacterium]